MVCAVLCKQFTVHKRKPHDHDHNAFVFPYIIHTLYIYTAASEGGANVFEVSYFKGEKFSIMHDAHKPCIICIKNF